MKLHALLTSLLLFTLTNLISQQIHVSEDFNAGSLPAGWSTNAISGTQAWSVGPNGASVHVGNTNLNGSSFAYFDDDALGGGSTNNHATLSSPAFNNTAYLKSFLEFDYNARFFSGIADSFLVEVFDGNNWRQVFQRNTNDCGIYVLPQCSGNFPHAKIDISAFKNANCQVRFRYFDGNDWGWYVGIDNVVIYSPFNFDLAAAAVTAPYGSCNPSTDSLAVLIKNVGANQASNFTVSYQLASNLVVSLSVSDTILPSDSLIVEFTNPINRNPNISQALSVYLSWTADLWATNDTLKTTLDSLAQPLQLPYFEKFETANHAWTVSGQNPSWAWGMPDTNLTLINSTLSGNNAFITNLNGPYNRNERSYLTSPCLDFSSISTIPVLSFDLVYQTESGFDFLWLEFSLDGGQSWNKVQKGSISKNWYNNATARRWEGNSTAWLKVINSLDQLTGESRVILRFVFNSDTSVLLEGIGVDNIFIKSTDGPDLSIYEITYPATGIRDSSSCQRLSSQEIIEAKIINLGSDTVRSFVAAFQKSGGAIVRDTITNLLLPPLADTNFQFISPISFPQNQLYNVNVWVEYPGDTVPQNDSLTQLIFDSSQPLNSIQTPFFEDFETVITPAVPTNWSTNTQANFFWQSALNLTSSGNTGPASSDGHFLFTEASSPAGAGDTAVLESPCIALNGLNSYTLSFDYHKHGASMGDLFIDVFDGVQWNNAVYRINGQTHPNQNDPWLRGLLDLNAYANRTIQLRFRGTYNTSFTGDMAIDNILLSDTSFIDVGISPALFFNLNEACFLSSQEQIKLRVTNFGEDNILPNQLSLSYKIGSQVVTELYPDTLKADSSRVFTFNQTADLSTAGQTYNIFLYSDLSDDARDTNDSLSLQVVNKGIGFSQSPIIFEDFESVLTVCHSNPYTRSNLPVNWSYSNLNTVQPWLVQNDSLCQFPSSSGATETNLTGPSSAHSGNKFLYFEPNIGSGFKIISGCMNTKNISQLTLEFYYYMYGDGMGKLLIEVEDSTGIIHTVDTVAGPAAFNGQTHLNNNLPWLKRQVVLDSFVNQPIEVSFRVIDVQSNRSDIAIDDVSFFNPLTVALKEKTKVILSIYPNPSKGLYNINTNQALAGERYQVFDLKGQIIQEGALEDNFNQIDLSQTPAGVYFIRIDELGLKEKLVKY